MSELTLSAKKNARRLKSGGCTGLLIAAFGMVPACDRQAASEPHVVIYTSVDQEFAAKILQAFEKKTGVRVEAVYDTEAAKTTGLVVRLAREKQRPRCDVWWSNEVFGTMQLAREGLLAPYSSPAAADIPAAWKDRGGVWTGLAARARVLTFNPERINRDKLPRTWKELNTPEWAGRLALANPLFGTTRGHLAAMFAYWGERDATGFLHLLRDSGARVVDGNSMAVQAVIRRSAEVAMTDTDDVWVARRRGETLEMIYPTIDADAPVMWIPCTAALVTGGPNPVNGRRMVDYLVSADVETALMNSDARHVPVRESLRASMPFESPTPTPLDYERAFASMTRATEVAREVLLR